MNDDDRLTPDEFNFIQKSLFCYCSHLTNTEIDTPFQVSMFYQTNRVKALADLMDKLRSFTDD